MLENVILDPVRSAYFKVYTTACNHQRKSAVTCVSFIPDTRTMVERALKLYSFFSISLIFPLVTQFIFLFSVAVLFDSCLPTVLILNNFTSQRLASHWWIIVAAPSEGRIENGEMWWFSHQVPFTSGILGACHKHIFEQILLKFSKE